MGKLGNLAYNIGTSLNQEDINTHRQTITPTEKTLQGLSTEDRLAYHAQNQAVLDENKEQLEGEKESGDGMYNMPGVAQGVGKTRQKDCRKAGVSPNDCSAYIWARSVSRAKNIASVLVPTSPEEVAFMVATAGGGYVLKVAGKAGVKVIRSFKSKKELDEAVEQAQRAKVEANVANSKAARESSSFKQHANATKAIEKGLIPHAESAIIDSRKLTEYALNPNHEVGKHKAKVFESALGYNQSNADELILKIKQGLKENPAQLGKKDQYGQRYTVNIPIQGPNGKTAIVTTGWILESGSKTPKLTTALVK